MSGYALELHHISKAYQDGQRKNVVLDDISLNVKKGEFIAVIGPSGSGKSTFLEIAGMLLSPDAGGTPVSLAGSAWADWVTDAGSYTAAEDRFTPAGDRTASGPETTRYVLQMRRMVYEQYVCARQVLECNYFQMRMGGQK